MNEALQMSSREILPDIHNVTFSRALEDGLTHYGWLSGEGTEKCGQGVALASHSVSREKGKELKMNDIYGPLFGGLSGSAGLQSCLESRLRVLMEGNGSPEYELTWKEWDMRSGVPICALRASAHRTLDKDCGGWATPSAMTRGAHTGEEAGSLGPGCRISEKGIKFGMTLDTMATMAGRPTPAMRDYKGANDLEHTTEKIAEGRRGHMGQLPNAVIVQLTGSDQFGGRAVTDIIGEYLPEGWEIPKNGKLNPGFSLWLMGYPAEWVCCGARAMQSCRKKGRCS